MFATASRFSPSRATRSFSLCKISASDNLHSKGTATSKTRLVCVFPPTAAKVVHAQVFAEFGGDGAHLLPPLVDLGVVVHERVDVHGQLDARIFRKIFFDAVGEVVCVHDGHAAVHLDVHGRIQLILPVVMHGQIVQPAHAVEGEHPLFDLLHGLAVGAPFPKGAKRCLSEWKNR